MEQSSRSTSGYDILIQISGSQTCLLWTFADVRKKIVLVRYRTKGNAKGTNWLVFLSLCLTNTCSPFNRTRFRELKRYFWDANAHFFIGTSYFYSVQVPAVFFWMIYRFAKHLATKYCWRLIYESEVHLSLD